MKKILLLLLLAVGLQAQTFTVSTAQEFSDALNSAADNTENDTIILNRGTYLADDYIQFQYITKDHSNLTIKAAAGLSKSDVIIDGNQKSRVLALIDEDIEKDVSQLGLYTIENLTITNGKSGTVGGGIKSSYPLVLNSVDVTHNYAALGGGGIWLQGAFELTDCNVSNNSISNEYNAKGDAAIDPEYFGNQITYNSKIINSIFSHNSVPLGGSYQRVGGGGVIDMYYGTLTIENSTFNDNKGVRVGAVAANYLNVKDSNFTNNYSGSTGAISAWILNAKNVIFQNNYSGAIYVKTKGEISNSVFENNSGKDSIVSAHGTTISNSRFNNNSATKIIDGAKEVKNSIFKNNISSDVIFLNVKYISNSIFLDNINNSTDRGGMISGWNSGSNAYIINSIFKGNKANIGSAIHHKYSNFNVIINSVFVDNNTSLDEAVVSTNGLFINNIISEPNRTAGENDISYTGDAYLYNNYIDLAKTTNPDGYEVIQKNSYRPSSYELGLDENFRLTASSGLINLGLNPNSTQFDDLLSKINDAEAIAWIKDTLKKDADGNIRTVGTTVDLGAYEFGSTTAIPTIESINITGTKKEFQELSFDVNYTIANGRTIDSLTFDYENNSSFVTDTLHTFNKPGDYIVTVKVTDDNGEYAVASKTITIAPLAFADMTHEQKLVKAIDPAYYDDIIAIIEQEKSVANKSGHELGLYDGKQYVQDNLAEFNLTKISTLTLKASDISALSSGWSLVSSPLAITDLSIFDTASVIWVYNNSSASWSAYSSDATTKQKIIDAADINLLTTIPAGSGLWIYK